MYRRYLKRVLDVCVAGGLLVGLAPVLGLVAVAIRLDDGGGALFRQVRVGRDGRPFVLRKFRSMSVDSPDVPSSEAGALRVTRVGRILRRTNLDELPQLLHVLTGDMSLVGPRPALATQEELLALRRGNGAASCRPGLTGLAQVCAYDGMPTREKAEWDGRYASRISLWGDLTILLRTVGYLLRRPPVY